MTHIDYNCKDNWQLSFYGSNTAYGPDTTQVSSSNTYCPEDDENKRITQSEVSKITSEKNLKLKYKMEIISKIKKSIIKLGLILFGYFMFIYLLPEANRMLSLDPYSIWNVSFMIGLWMGMGILSIFVLVKYIGPIIKNMLNKWLEYKNKTVDIIIIVFWLFTIAVSVYYLILIDVIIYTIITIILLLLFVANAVALSVKYNW